MLLNMMNNIHQKVLEAISCHQPLLIELNNRSIYGKIVGLGKIPTRGSEVEKVAVVQTITDPEEYHHSPDISESNSEILDIRYEDVRNLTYIHRG